MTLRQVPSPGLASVCRPVKWSGQEMVLQILSALSLPSCVTRVHDLNFVPCMYCGDNPSASLIGPYRMLHVTA